MTRHLESLSLIIPIFNEAESLPHLRRALEIWIPSLEGREHEIILVNDGSTDESMQLLEQWAHQNHHIKVIDFSRNFGHQAAVTAGLHHARMDAAVILDADLQDPLSIIHDMIACYERGYDVAYGQRTHREGESGFKRFTAWAFYRLMRSCIHKDLPVDTGDFRLVSRACIDAVNSMPESHRFLRGMFAWAGFPQIAVPYTRSPRSYGETKYPLRKMLQFAWNAITAFSPFPIRLVTAFGLLNACIGVGVGIYALASYLSGNAVQGWTSLIGFLAFLGGSILIGLGTIGEYIGKIYEEVKGRPQYIIRKQIGA